MKFMNTTNTNTNNLSNNMDLNCDFDSVLKCFLDAQIFASETLRSGIYYAVLNGGKRFRVKLMLAMGDALKLNVNILTPFMIAIELIHAFSLVHDDLPAMDDDALRRGKPSCHIKYGEAQAILVGDALQSLAFQAASVVMTGYEKAQIQSIHLLAKYTGIQGMAAGQSLDLEAEKMIFKNIDPLQKIHQLKTGALIQASILIPLYFSSSFSESQMMAFEKLSNWIGVAYQIQDDILDLTEDTQTLGKPANSDLENDKNTYPKILGLLESKKQLLELYEEINTFMISLEKLYGLNLSKLKFFMHQMQDRCF